MGTHEKLVMNEILLSLTPDEFLMRTNAGNGWAGKILDKKPGVLVLGSPRPFYGCITGWPDLTGWRTVTVTEDMVGTRIAQLYTVEVKTAGTRMTPGQEVIRDRIVGAGGIYDIR